MIDTILTAAAPLILASQGALLTELAGALGIFIEGFMTLGAFFAFFFTIKTGSTLAGCLFTACGAGIIGFALAWFVRQTRSNPFVAGLALNLLASGVTASLSAGFFGTKGVLRNMGVGTPDRLFVYLAGGLTFVIAFVIRRTSIGPRLISSGSAPEAARERGIRPERYREGAWAVAAGLAALAGACLTFRIGAYTPGGVAGRGWIALAAVYLGFRTVWGTAAAAVVFAVVEYIGISAQTLGGVPATVVLGVPSALALVLYTLSCIIKSRGRRGGG
jgi:simple sugar transport system permease protein